MRRAAVLLTFMLSVIACSDAFELPMVDPRHLPPKEACGIIAEIRDGNDASNVSLREWLFAHNNFAYVMSVARGEETDRRHYWASVANTWVNVRVFDVPTGNYSNEVARDLIHSIEQSSLEYMDILCTNRDALYGDQKIAGCEDWNSILVRLSQDVPPTEISIPRGMREDIAALASILLDGARLGYIEDGRTASYSNNLSAVAAASKICQSLGFGL